MIIWTEVPHMRVDVILRRDVRAEYEIIDRDTHGEMAFSRGPAICRPYSLAQLSGARRS